MSNEKYNISRRSVLGGLGAVGLASAGAGLGTTAFLNDTESFNGNSITAGELDLRVDWQQHYYGPSEQWEFVNAHPDHDGDGEQSLDLGQGEVVKYSDQNRNIVDHLNCSNLDHNYDFNGQESLVELSDVKPGDEGEITFSVHLCDNPGYLWLTADNFTETGGVSTEPENATMEPGQEDLGELAQNTFVEVWYDKDCDNQLDSGTDEERQELEVALVSDTSGSMSQEIGDLKSAAKGFVDNLSTPDEAAAISFASNASLDQELTTTYQDVKDAIDQYTAGGTTNMSAGISTGHNELVNGANATAGASKVLILLTDGEPNNESAATADATAAKNAGIRIFTIALGSGADTSFLENNIASSPSDAYVAPDPSDLANVYSQIAQVVSQGEQLILGKGVGPYSDHVSLAEAMDVMERNNGRIPLDADGNMGWDAGDADAERDCFEAGESYCIGVRWWVPKEVGNEIQGDTVGFDLGFYAEQCRHNNGAGQRPTTAAPTTTQ